MNLHELHAQRRRILNDIIGAERAGQNDLAFHLLREFNECNQKVRDAEELDYHPHDTKHDLAMMAVLP